MNILVTGATGLIGSALCPALEAAGHRVAKLKRGAGASPSWNPEAGIVNLGLPASCEAVLHLAGESIGARWTRERKRRIRESRVGGTKLLCESLAKLSPLPRVLVCASATGFYGDRADERLDEASPPGRGFLADICREWEAAAAPATAAGIRVVHLRFGIVLAGRGGALAKMLPVFRLGLGGRLGDGRQFWSWIALGDVVGAIAHAIHCASLRGPVNVVSPQPATNGEFTAALARALRRPAFFAVPGVAVRLLFGEMGREALLASARVQPARLEASGFQFQFPDLDSALREALIPSPGLRRA